MVTETPLEATERLRREGCWERASRYREEQRQRLLAEGKPRKVAREESRRMMIEAYPPPDHEAFYRYMALALLSPSCCPQGLKRDFAGVWYVLFHFKAECYMQPRLLEADSAMSATRARLEIDDPNALPTLIEVAREYFQLAWQADEDADELPRHQPANWTNTLLNWAVEAPLAFIDLAQCTFTKVLANLRDATPLVEATKSELQALMDGMPALSAAIVKHWPPEFTGHAAGG